MNDNWLDKIHDRMTDFETEEPAGLWSAIENRRKTTSGVSNMAKIAVIKMRIRRVAAVAASLAVIGTAAFFLFTDNGNEQVTLRKHQHSRCSVGPGTQSICTNNRRKL